MKLFVILTLIVTMGFGFSTGNGAISRAEYNTALREMSEAARAIGMNCKWEGTAPFCRGSCSSGWLRIGGNAYGDGSTCISGEKSYCCQISSIPQEYLGEIRKFAEAG